MGFVVAEGSEVTSRRRQARPDLRTDPVLRHLAGEANDALQAQQALADLRQTIPGDAHCDQHLAHRTVEYDATRPRDVPGEHTLGYGADLGTDALEQVRAVVHHALDQGREHGGTVDGYIALVEASAHVGEAVQFGEAHAHQQGRGQDEPQRGRQVGALLRYGKRHAECQDLAFGSQTTGGLDFLQRLA
jgi:hypothetical protein